MIDYYILKGKTPVEATLMEWGTWFQDNDRVVKHTELPDGVRVSTVFLGLNHAWRKESPPLIFETMIFGGEHDQYQERYSTWDEAEEGHERAIKIAKNEIKEEEEDDEHIFPTEDDIYLK